MFKGKRIWITGASSGIGQALAEQLAAKGALLVLSARRRAQLQQLAESLPGQGHQVLPLDLADLDDALPKAKAFLADHPVDILINNAGISQRSRVQDTDLAVYRRLMEVDYFAVVALTQLVLPTMLAKGQGQVVTVASVAGKVGSKLRSGYSGAKFAAVGFMDCLRAEVAGQGVGCLTVFPGYVQTDIAKAALTATGQAQGHSDPGVDGGISPGQCAQAIVQAMAKGKDELIVGRGISVLAPRLQRFFPGLVRKMVARSQYT